MPQDFILTAQEIKMLTAIKEIIEGVTTSERERCLAIVEAERIGMDANPAEPIQSACYTLLEKIADKIRTGEPVTNG